MALLDGLVELLEDFRVHCSSYWSSFYYFLMAEFTWNNALGQVSRQSVYLQLAAVVLSSLVFICLSVRIWMKLTMGWCKSKARMDGRTVLITGANSGKSHNIRHEGVAGALALHDHDCTRHRFRDRIEPIPPGRPGNISCSKRQPRCGGGPADSRLEPLGEGISPGGGSCRHELSQKVRCSSDGDRGQVRRPVPTSAT